MRFKVTIIEEQAEPPMPFELELEAGSELDATAKGRERFEAERGREPDAGAVISAEFLG